MSRYVECLGSRDLTTPMSLSDGTTYGWCMFCGAAVITDSRGVMAEHALATPEGATSAED